MNRLILRFMIIVLEYIYWNSKERMVDIELKKRILDLVKDADTELKKETNREGEGL